MKKKISLEALSVTSFVTSMNANKKCQVLGGEFTDVQQCGGTFTQRPTGCTNLIQACFVPNCATDEACTE